MKTSMTGRKDGPEGRNGASRGNALFLILIAVALFAALSYAVTQSGRGGGSVKKEQAQLLAAQIIQNASMIEQTVTRMVLMGTLPGDLVFSDPVNKCPGDARAVASLGAANVALFCTTGVNCVFAPEGGGAALPSSYGGTVAPDRGISMLGPHASFGICDTTGANEIDGVGTTTSEIVIDYSDISPEVCAAIDRILGFPSIVVVTTAAHAERDGMSEVCYKYQPTGRHIYKKAVMIN